MVGSVLNAPRDLGFVKISKTTREILSSGAEETGGYYNYAGEWTAHTNIGITFLTHQKSMEESVSRIKTFSLNSSRILLAYEIWTAKSYVATEFMVIDADGGIVQSPWRACFPMRTIKADDGMVVGGRAVMYAGGLDNTLHRYEVCVDGSCESGGSSQVPVPPAPSPPYFTRKGLSDIAPEDCVDKNIRACNKDMCTGDYWYKYVLNNCPRMCGFCAPLETTAPPTVPPTTPPTTPSIAPEDCVDTGSCNQGMCTSDFWGQYARDKCQKTCGFCTPLETTAPPTVPPTTPPTTPPIAPEDCVDAGSCNQGMCTSDFWGQYARDKCQKTCGFCTPLETTAPPTVPPTTPPTTPPIAPEDCVDAGSCNQGMCTSDFWGQYA
eukprot:CAMPEP_0180736500 /NCGR_PEP_ID=MMETSP1038_2-20121128/23798_1 /TAXON_ID=632150 /ORGANISM="Azadinium spinosum, Strain 3D9" /LENGTH=378 /DNA_ID=CAMNT_0022769555 /DNA_START=21 /DNA_END=1153 /DNA_ORIENTATION=-